MEDTNSSKSNFKPYISPSDFIPEFTPKAIILGAIFGIIFGAATVYLGLKVGLTVSASIPIAVLAIAVFKKIGKSTILENNIVQTIGSAGESVAAGVVFTIPALLFLPGGEAYFQYFQIFVLALTGGLLGVLFMIPLRRSLIVKEHGILPFPEGTACADVLIAGEKGGNLAKKVYYGLGIAFLYKFFMSIIGLWKDVPAYIFSRKSALPNGTINGEITPELLGVGYIIGPKISGIMVAGGVLSWLVLIPLITLLGDQLVTAFPPATKLISEMSPSEIWSNYIRYIGAGAVTFGGIVTLIKSFPTIISAFKDSFGDFKENRTNTKNNTKTVKIRTEKDIPLVFVLGGSVLLILFMTLIPNIPTNFLSAIMIVVFGFFFVTVSSRIVGIIGSSSNPISGMTIATLMATALIFVGVGWTGEVYQPIALVVGSIVCIASANAGATSQDLKTGYIVGATPIKQQIGLLIGVLASVVVIGFTLLLLNNTLGIGAITESHPNPLPAPQATLMATVIKGLLSQNLPWALVLVGMGIAAVMELSGVRSLPFAVGAYLPLSTTSPIFIGGLVKWVVDKKKKSKDEETEIGPGALFSSGLIAGGALTGILIAILIGTPFGTDASGKDISIMDKLNTGISQSLGASGDIISLALFAGLALILFKFATSKES
ncbi:MAG: oligopeptide transporter, OPT family [Ignavibacteriaceae bacterium]|nr:oligopeptide transporter, OPT family [Ignavibacterium sp.]MCC6253905.1 oligopeptide transporter, OPT family [Ignavibacteriaceae bacterium]HMN23246.1 oligopeptide transporter, OPT family [Ignavibacteriaceae bacterium]HRN25608.1 oligopeptide transporter, OPT family [Ignavibacteriaceae bacterium]HRQ53227.1 oligopeptide transporter, OPT family [Ignavibacteriaceae bacterium]